MSKHLKGLTQAQAMWVSEFLEHGDAVLAYRKSHPNSRLKDSSLANSAYKMKNHKKVGKVLELMRIDLGKQTMMNAKDVLQEWIDIATADPNELMSFQRRCCRHCYGRGHQYQWADADEFAYALGQALSHKRKAGDARMPIPCDDGGYGFRFNLKPHPECTKCLGEGLPEVFICDTRNLSAKGRKLYAGIKQTTNGLQILTRDQDGALANIAKALGMTPDKLQVTGADGGPLISATLALPADSTEAANVYAQIVKSGARK